MMLNSIKTNLKIIYTNSSKKAKTKAGNTCKEEVCNSQEFS